MAAASSAIPLGLLTPSILAESLSPVPRLAPGLISYQGNPPLHQSSVLEPSSRLYQSGVPLGLTSRWKMVTTDASNLGWGDLHKGKLVFGSWSILEQLLHINCLEMLAVFLALKNFLPALKRQHDGDSLYQPTRQYKITIPLQDGSTPPVVGIQQTPLTQSSSCAGQIEPRGRPAVQRQCISRGMEITSSDGSNEPVYLSRGQRWISLPQKTTFTAQFISRNSEMPWPMFGPALACMPFL